MADPSLGEDAPCCLIVTDVLDVGGIDEFVALLARRLPETGWRVRVLKTGRPGGYLAGLLRSEGIAVDEARTPEALDAAVRASGARVASVHSPALWVLQALTRHHLSMVETLHGAPTPLGTDWPSEPARSRLITAFLPVSERVALHYRRGNPGFPAGAVVPVPIGYDSGARPVADRQASRDWLGLREEFLFTSLGRVSAEKNTFGLIDSFTQIAPARPDCQLLIAGRVDDGNYARQCLHLVGRQTADVQARIHLREHTNEVPQVLAASDCFVMDSFYEGWGMACVEALAAGSPLVRSDTGGALEQIGKHGERGVIVGNPAGDPDSIDWSTISRWRYAEQTNRTELADALGRVADARADWAQRRSGLIAQTPALFPIERCLRSYDHVLRLAGTCSGAQDFARVAPTQPDSP